MELSASHSDRFTPCDRAPSTYRRLGRAYSWSGQCDEKNRFPPPGIQHQPSSPKPVTTPSELSWLSVSSYSFQYSGTQEFSISSDQPRQCGYQVFMSSRGCDNKRLQFWVSLQYSALTFYEFLNVPTNKFNYTIFLCNS
jgi:hypothetical protein